VRDLMTEEREEAALAEAYKLLRPLTKPARSWGIVSWTDPDAADPRDLYEAAREYVIALLDPNPADSRARQAADEFLDAHSPIAAPIVRKVVLPALRLGRLPKKKGPHGILLRDRCIAAVVTTICRQYRLNPRLSAKRRSGLDRRLAFLGVAKDAGQRPRSNARSRLADHRLDLRHRKRIEHSIENVEVDNGCRAVLPE
jgi:hypothetical protein